MRALCVRMGSGHRPGLPSVTAQCDSRAFAGAQKCSGGSRAWRCFRRPELSGRVAGAAAACATRRRVVPAGPAAPTEGGGGQELPARCCQLLLSKAACGLSLLRGLAGVCTVSLFSSLSAPRAPPGSTLAQAPASGAGPGLCPAAPKLPALTAALPSLCAASARSRSAEVLSRPRGVTPRFLSALWEGGRARSRVGFTPRDPVLLSSLSWHQARC